MSFYRVQSEFTYRSVTDAGQSYYFDIAILQNGQVEVRNIVGPYGPLTGAQGLPYPVNNDIQLAIAQSQATVVSTSTYSGQATFTAATSQTINFDTPLGSASYRVLLDVPDFIAARVRLKSTTGFVIETSVTYTGVIGFEVFI
jgi:hypothetical protein